MHFLNNFNDDSHLRELCELDYLLSKNLNFIKNKSIKLSKLFKSLYNYFILEIIISLNIFNNIFYLYRV